MAERGNASEQAMSLITSLENKIREKNEIIQKLRNDYLCALFLQPWGAFIFGLLVGVLCMTLTFYGKGLLKWLKIV